MFSKRKDTIEFLDELKSSSEKEEKYANEVISDFVKFKRNTSYELMKDLGLTTLPVCKYLADKEENEKTLKNLQEQLDIIEYFRKEYDYHFVSDAMLGVILDKYKIRFDSIDFFLKEIDTFSINRVETFKSVELIENDVKYVKLERENGEYIAKTITKEQYDIAKEKESLNTWFSSYKKMEAFKVLSLPENFVTSWYDEKYNKYGKRKIKEDFYVLMYPVRYGYLYITGHVYE